MPNNDFLPFHNLDDRQFLLLNNESENNELLPFDIIDNLTFSNLNTNEDRHVNEIDPDNYLVNSLNYKPPLCNYVFPDTPQAQSPSEKSFNIISFNINSVPLHLEEFCENCLNPLPYKFNIIGLCETKLTDDIEQLYNIPSYEKITNNFTRSSGGVAIFIKSGYKYTKRDDLSILHNSIETVFLEIHNTNSKNIIVGIIYRRPRSDFLQFLEKYTAIISTVGEEDKLCYLSGDYNLDLLKSETDDSVRELVRLSHSRLFFNSIIKPTRVTSTTATIIDHIWSNNFNQHMIGGIVYSQITDHFPVFACFTNNDNSSQDPIETEKIITYRDYSNHNMDNFKEALEHVSWDIVYCSNDPNVIYSNFMIIFTALFTKFFPVITKRIKLNHLHKPYITPEIQEMISEKNKLARKFALRPITFGERYHRLRNQVTQTLRTAKGNHYKRKLEEGAGDCKKAWNVINTVLGREKNNNLSDTFLHNNIEISESDIIADQFNSYFVNVGKTLAEGISESYTSFNSYLTNQHEEIFLMHPVTRDELFNTVSELKDSSPGCDGVPLKVLRALLPSLCLSFCIFATRPFVLVFFLTS